MITGLLAAGIVATAAGPLWPLELHALGKVIKKESQRVSQPHQPAQEFVAGRKALRADINGDHKEDLIVLFTLERGDTWTQYLTVLSSAGKALATTQVSRKGVRSVDLDQTHGPVIQLASKRYRPEDLPCCPSELGQVSYLLRGHRLTEMKPSTVAASRPGPAAIRRAHARGGAAGR